MSSTQEVGDIFGAGKGPAHAMLRSPTVLIVSVGLWGMNIFFFQLFGLQYKYILNYDLRMLAEADYDNNNNNNNSNSSVDPEDDDNTHHHHHHHKRESSKSSIDGGDRDKKPNKAMPSSPDPKGTKGSRQKHPTSPPPTPPTQSTTIELVQLSGSKTSGSNSHQYHHHHHHHAHLATAKDNSPYATIAWYKLVLFSIALLALLHAISHYWMDHLGRDVLGAVFLFYGVVIVYIFLPIKHNRWLQRAFVIVLQRCWELIRPRCHCVSDNIPRPIPFIDVFFADAMCSLSKVFFDWGMLLHMASHYPNPVPPSMHNILIPSIFAAVPYVIRARQCLLMHTIGRMKNDPKRYQHVANAIKYSTSIFPLCLSAYQKTIDPAKAQDLEGVLILLLIINALYALYWDIVMDWGMMQNPTAVVASAAGCAPSVSSSSPSSSLPTTTTAATTTATTNSAGGNTINRLTCRHGFLRSRLRFGFVMSLLILLADSVLRFSWLLRFWPKLFPSPDAFILCTQFLEVFRRAIWNLLRIEWENIKQKAKQSKARDSLSDHEDEDDLFFPDDTNGNNNAIYEEEMVSFLPKTGASGGTGGSGGGVVGPIERGPIERNAGGGSGVMSSTSSLGGGTGNASHKTMERVSTATPTPPTKSGKVAIA